MAYRPDQREYRSFDAALMRSAEEDSYIVEGYATTFEPYVLYEMDGTEYKECIDRHALDEADMSDVIFLLNHEGTPFARQRNNTLSLFCDDHGVHINADLRGCRAGRDCYESITNGLIDRMSWAFTVDKDGWEYDQNTHTSTIKRIKKVYDVSAVSRPANEGTEIKARSYFDGVIELEQQELLLRQQEDKRERDALALKLL